MFKKLAEEERTMIFYESPMRLVKTLTEMMEYFGAERPCSVSRELTKLYEETKRLQGNPLFTRANTKAVAPGRHSTFISRLAHSRTNKNAGSEIPGVPASVTIAIFLPASN